MNTSSKAISLYSFKGGAGRTVCTANLAGIYANEIGASAENPILLMDMDLDSAGLTIFLEQEKRFEGSPWCAANVATGELALSIRGEGDRLFNEGLVDISAEVGAPKGSVLFMGAEVTGRDGATILEGDAGEKMGDFLYFCGFEKNVSTVLIDSASGRQEVALLCHSVSDLIIYCCRMTRQFLDGTDSHIKHFVRECQETSRHVPDFILLPVAVPEKSERFENARKNAFLKLNTIVSTLGGTINIEVLDDPGIGEVESFKWIERVLQTKEKEALTLDETNAIRSYRLLATKVIEFLNKER